MNKPKCFGRVSVNSRAPCYACGLLPDCCKVFSENKGTIGVLAWPRAPRRKEESRAREGTVLVTVMDERVYEDLAEKLFARGLFEMPTQKMWKWGQVKLVRVIRCACADIDLFFPLKGRFIQTQVGPNAAVSVVQTKAKKGMILKGAIVNVPGIQYAVDAVSGVIRGYYPEK